MTIAQQRLVLLWLLLAMFGCVSLFGATYYIDPTAANDSANGTSTGTPWKRHPRMTGFTGSYTHAAGDRFIFKGGATNTLAITLTQGGAAGNRDYYGYDATWYVGGAWSRPIIDLGGSGTGIRLGDKLEHITIDGLEIRNVAPYCIFGQGLNNVTVTNCYLHAWTHTDLPDSWELAGGFVNFPNPFRLEYWGITNVLVTHCTIDNADGEGCGSGVANASEVAFNNIGHVPQLIMNGCQSVHDNEIHHPGQSISGDGTVHPNVCYFAIANGYALSPTNRYFYNNWLHDWRADNGTFPCLYISSLGTWQPATNRIFVFNNVFQMKYNFVLFDNEFENDSTFSTFECYFWNNTVESSGNNFFQVADRAGLSFRYVEAINNHVVDGGANYNPTSPKNPTGIWATSLVVSNLTQTLAAAVAQGYASNTFLYPPFGGSTIGTGSNLTSRIGQTLVNATTTRAGQVVAVSRPASGAWDIGAYQYATASSPATNRIIYAPSVTATSVIIN